jgi:uncharacterized membrane protein
VNTPRDPVRDEAERRIGRLLIAMTYVSVVLLVVGVLLLLAAGVSPLAGGPGLDLGTLGSEVLALGPAGFLWLGLAAVIATPIGRVVAAAVAYARSGDRSMVAIAVAILGIIAVGVMTAATATV